MPAAAPFAVVLVTAPDARTAAGLARSLVDARLAACVNLVPGIRSIYRWEGKMCDDAEVLCIVKTRHALLDALVACIREEHPYTVPEIIALPLVAGSAPYLAWLAAATRPDPGRSADRARRGSRPRARSAKAASRSSSPRGR